MFVNTVQVTEGISLIYSMQETVTQQQIDSAKHWKVGFGQYVETSKDVIITNTLKAWKYPCLTLDPSGNSRGLISVFALLQAR